jgi:hypothetical protein
VSSGLTLGKIREGQPVWYTKIGNLPKPSGRRSSMSEERFEQEQREDENEDVEAHKKVKLTEEPTSDDEGDDVEAHARKKI